MATNTEILPYHHQITLSLQTAAALTNYHGGGGGSSIHAATQLTPAAWSLEDHLYQQTELPGLTRGAHHLVRFIPYALYCRPQLQNLPPALHLQHLAAIAHAHNHHLQQSLHINNLLPELLEMIFDKLSVKDLGRAAQVCTTWRAVAYSKSIWKGVEAKLRFKRSSHFLLNCLVQRGINNVQVLYLRGPLKKLVVGVPALTSLNLRGLLNVADINLSKAFSVNLTNLKVLDLSLCKQITDSCFERIAQHLKNLETLELGGSCNITNTGLRWIALGLKKLKNLNLRSCWRISDQGIGHLAGVNKATAEGNFELEYLDLQNCQRLSDEALGHIAQGLTSLKSINLSFCGSITDSGLKHLARMPKLEQLNLRFCYNISNIGMCYLTEGGSGINSLDVSFCDKISDQALTHIARGLHRLKSLSLSQCKITDQGMLSIAKNLPDLEHLNIGQCSRITDKSLQTLAEELTNLKTIDLYGCTQLSSKGIDVIMKLPKLVKLNLGLWLVR